MAPSDVKFPAAEDYPKWAVSISLIFGVPLFFWFTYAVGNQFQGFIACLSASSVALVFMTLRKWRRLYSFWIAFCFNVVAHALIVSMMPNADTHFPGVIFAPLVVIDLLFWQVITVVLIRTLRF